MKSQVKKFTDECEEITMMSSVNYRQRQIIGNSLNFCQNLIYI